MYIRLYRKNPRCRIKRCISITIIYCVLLRTYSKLCRDELNRHLKVFFIQPNICIYISTFLFQHTNYAPLFSIVLKYFCLLSIFALFRCWFFVCLLVFRSVGRLSMMGFTFHTKVKICTYKKINKKLSPQFFFCEVSLETVYKTFVCFSNCNFFCIFISCDFYSFFVII